MPFSDLKENISQLLLAVHRDLVSEQDKESAAYFFSGLVTKVTHIESATHLLLFLKQLINHESLDKNLPTSRYMSFYLRLECYLSECELIVLDNIAADIFKQVKGPGFNLGCLGSSYSINDSKGNIYPVPQRVSRIMNIIRNENMSSNQRLKEVKEIQIAVPAHQSSYLFWNTTDKSTNEFISNLQCG
ncbi:hypothetical protein [Piscirickettsia salmonis]|uniref:hypothetical protein n=1 Tax=Piscirickettsia salmonis TaxID=1238 RepID=UPI0007C8ADE2|nr:hypothetical protein A0O36_00833 [Piscirickettsiaceae bacterium NZ-RLO1]